MHITEYFGLFGGASEPGFTICDRFVVSLCTVAEGLSFWPTNLRGTANIVSVVLVVSFTTIVVSKKSGTSSGRSMWVSVLFSALSATQ